MESFSPSYFIFVDNCFRYFFYQELLFLSGNSICYSYWCILDTVSGNFGEHEWHPHHFSLQVMLAECLLNLGMKDYLISAIELIVEKADFREYDVSAIICTST